MLLVFITVKSFKQIYEDNERTCNGEHIKNYYVATNSQGTSFIFYIEK